MRSLDQVDLHHDGGRGIQSATERPAPARSFRGYPPNTRARLTPERLRVLEFLAQAPEASVREIARACRVALATAHRYLSIRPDRRA